MKTLKLLTVFVFLLAISFSSNAQTNTGKVYLIRVTGYTGSAVNYSIFVDGKLICKLKNKAYSVHDLSPGEHTVSVSSGGLSTGKKSAPLTINVVAGTTNYLSVVSTQSGYANKITCQEITANSAAPLLAKAEEKKDCLSKE